MNKIYKYCMPNNEDYKKMINVDLEMNRMFQGGTLSKKFFKSLEWRFIKCYRKLQANKNNIWRKLYALKLEQLERKTGFSFENNLSIGEGLIIGHKGTIVINGQACFGSYLFITHGVTIGRDIRGKRAGAPTFGDRVCIRANSTVVGNIRIGNDVLIAPNTFVNFDVPDHSVVIGNPAEIHHRDSATEGHIPIVQKNRW